MTGEPCFSATRLRPDQVPEPALRIAERLKSAGGQSWLVGGAVRDLLLGRAVNDWDLATDLLPEQVSALFPRTHEFGIRFGTVVVMEKGVPYEVTTFRRDGIYTDARRPDDVQFTRILEEDLVRRDFTVNALAYDPVADRLADPAGGLADLREQLLRAVGRAEERFQEDALRLLRAVRFSAQLDFDLEAGTYRALVLCAPRLERIAQERIRDEFDKLLASPHPAPGLALLHETGLLRRILPELAASYGVPQNPHHAYDVFHHSLAAVEMAPAGAPVIRLAALLHDLGKPECRAERADTASFYGHQFAGERMADQVLRRLRYPNEVREQVRLLVRLHMFHYRPEWTDAAIRRFLRDVGRENLDDLFALRAADTMGNGLRRRLAPELAELRARVDREIDKQSAISVKDLRVRGDDLMEALGIGPGPRVGALLHLLLQEVLDEPERNERDSLLRRAAELNARGEDLPPAWRSREPRAGGERSGRAAPEPDLPRTPREPGR